jgi:hypothetical protein
MEQKYYIVDHDNDDNLTSVGLTSNLKRLPFIVYKGYQGNEVTSYTAFGPAIYVNGFSSFENIEHNRDTYNLYIPKSWFKEIVKEDIPKLYIEIEKDKIKQTEKNKKKLKTKVLLLKDRKYESLSSKLLLNTNMNFTSYQKNINQGVTFALDCMQDLIISNDDIYVYIPKLWLKYFGYNLGYLRRYLNFLKRCGIDFNYEYLGEKSVEELYRVHYNNNNNNYSLNILNLDKENSYLPLNSNFHIVKIEKTSNSLHTYMHFCLLRYIYNHKYWNLPLTAMKLKANTKLSYWNCLLLAHNMENYDGYYALKTTDQLGGLFINSNNQKDIINKLEEESDGYEYECDNEDNDDIQYPNLNSCFNLEYNQQKIENFRNLFLKEDYKQIEKEYAY